MFKFLHQDQWFTSLILIAGVLLLSINGLMIRFDYVFYDIGQYLTPNKAPDDIVIVAIDEPSIEQLGRWPWTRETHAQLIRQLNKSQIEAVGFDVLFSEPDQLHSLDDKLFVDAVKTNQSVVFPVVLESVYPGAPVTQKDTMANLKAVSAGVGRVNIPLDGDGIARGIYLWERLTGPAEKAQWLPHFAQSILSAANQLSTEFTNTYQTTTDQATAQIQQHYKKIDFYGGASSFTQVSYVDVWSGRVSPSVFDGKIVLVGATSIGMGDLVATPMSSFASPMTGVEFNANVIAAMRDGELISDLPAWINTLVAMLLVILPVIWLPNQTPLKSLVYILVYIFIILVISILLPNLMHIWFKPTALILMVLLAYPIWSWRRLDRAHAHLNVELQQLKTDLMEFGLQADQVVATDQKLGMRDDLLQSRISQVRYASSLLRDLQHKKNETLAFISHDLRMPLATAMMMLNDDDFAQKKSRIAAMLHQANQLAENFLSISKAETLNSGNFREVELSGLLQEAVDHIYQLTKQKSIKVKLNLPEEPVWVSGDFTLLHRACVNVLNNAIKFSETSGLVEVGLCNIDDEAQITIKDYGQGIDKDKLDQVFVKFKRLEGQPVMQGSGLGLYFVDVTVKKHNGEVSVDSKLGHWTEFKIEIPILDLDD